MRVKIDTVSIQKEQAQLLRANGMAYCAIAKTVGISRDSARNYSRAVSVAEENHELDAAIENHTACAYCGSAMTQHGGAGRPRRFCSDRCRRQYWRLHREEQKKNPAIIFTRTCKYCGAPFEIYGKNERKYFCRDHYIKHFWGENAGQQSKTCTI